MIPATLSGDYLQARSVLSYTFIPDLKEEMGCTYIKSADETNLGSVFAVLGSTPGI